MSKITPMNDRILLQEEAKKTTTASGIIIDGNLGDDKIFSIIEVGTEVQHLTVGERVLVDLREGRMLTVDGKQYIIVKEKDVVARLS